MCVRQWKRLDLNLPSCLVFRNTDGFFQGHRCVPVFQLTYFVPVLEFHPPVVLYDRFLPVTITWAWGSWGPCSCHRPDFIVFDGWASVLCTYHIVFMHSSVDGYDGGFQILTAVNSAGLVLYWAGTWWSRVDDGTVKEGKRLIFPGLHSRLSRSRESARNRKRERKKDMGTQALMEQRCFNQHGVGKYTVLQGSYSQQT